MPGFEGRHKNSDVVAERSRRPVLERPLFLASLRQKPYHFRRLHTRYGSRRARAHVQRRDPMALNRKICKNLAHNSYGVGNAIR
jgi:hypothetical protein